MSAETLACASVLAGMATPDPTTTTTETTTSASKQRRRVRSDSDADDVDDGVIRKRTFVHHSSSGSRTIIDDDDSSDTSATTVDPPCGERLEKRYHVKAIHDRRTIGGVVHYHVEWVGYPSKEHFTWEPVSELEEAQCHILIKAFNRFDRFRRARKQKNLCYADYVRRNPLPRSYGADAFGTCVLNALRIAGTLIGENVFSDTVVANFKCSTKDKLERHMRLV